MHRAIDIIGAAATAETVDDVAFPRQGAPSFRATQLEIDPQPDTRPAIRQHYPDPGHAELEGWPIDEGQAWADDMTAVERDRVAASFAGFREDELGESTEILQRPWWQAGARTVEDEAGDVEDAAEAVGAGGVAVPATSAPCPAPSLPCYHHDPFMYLPAFPWYTLPDQNREIDEADVEADVDALADAIVEKLNKEKKERVGDLASYMWGEAKVQQLVQYFDAVGRPSQFEAAVQAVYAAYEKTKTSFATLAAWVYDSKMKVLGQDAVDLMGKIQAAVAAANPGKPPLALPAGAPAPAASPGFWGSIGSVVPRWVWGAGAVAAIVAVGWLAAPLIVPLVARRHARGA